MKKIFLLAVFALIFSGALFAQDTEKQIAVIRAEVAAINKAAPKYSKQTKNVEEISLEGTEATFYVSGRGLKKVVARSYGETYNATGEYYFTGDELIFAFVKFNRYDRPLGSGGKSPKIASTEEQRFYFSSETLIRLLIGTKELKPGEERYEELKEEALGIADKLKKSL